GRDDQEGGGPDDRQAGEPARSEPALGGGRRRLEGTGRVVRTGWQREGTEAQAPAEPEHGRREHGDGREEEGERQRRDRDRPDRDLRAHPRRREGTEEHER